MNGTEYPYTTFRNTFYFIEFLKPVDLSSLPPEPSHEDYFEVAKAWTRRPRSVEARYETYLADNRERFAPLRRRGGSRFRVAWWPGSPGVEETPRLSLLGDAFAVFAASGQLAEAPTFDDGGLETLDRRVAELGAGLGRAAHVAETPGNDEGPRQAAPRRDALGDRGDAEEDGSREDDRASLRRPSFGLGDPRDEALEIGVAEIVLVPARDDVAFARPASRQGEYGSPREVARGHERRGALEGEAEPALPDLVDQHGDGMMEVSRAYRRAGEYGNDGKAPIAGIGLGQLPSRELGVDIGHFHLG